MNKLEKAHISKIKSMPCGLCGSPPPSDAHHTIQGRGGQRRVGHFLVIPLCKVCHQDNKYGIHGERQMWRAYNKDEFDVLNETIMKIETERE